MSASHQTMMDSNKKDFKGPNIFIRAAVRTFEGCFVLWLARWISDLTTPSLKCLVHIHSDNLYRANVTVMCVLIIAFFLWLFEALDKLEEKERIMSNNNKTLFINMSGNRTVSLHINQEQLQSIMQQLQQNTRQW
ncbi:uncharacterized protein LOC131939522 [Physella acuta]|uniref:uncharacterized protein LOC131939522 n=1 Tax=Physella acuta TaxID=109671 RepID=UPI0027DD9F6C|nr:uncharacterized protein LOC131939522 [Physella acuta]